MEEIRMHLDNCCFNRSYEGSGDFDYTKWRKDHLLQGVPVKGISRAAIQNRDGLWVEEGDVDGR